MFRRRKETLESVEIDSYDSSEAKLERARLVAVHALMYLPSGLWDRIPGAEDLARERGLLPPVAPPSDGSTKA